MRALWKRKEIKWDGGEWRAVQRYLSSFSNFYQTVVSNGVWAERVEVSLAYL